MIFKYVIPFDQFVIHSRMSSVEAVQALQAVVEPARILRFSTAGAKAFQGKIDARGFRITRIIGYRNSWLPVVVGTVDPAPGGAVIRIHMRLIVFVALFSAAWVGAAGFTALSYLIRAISYPVSPALDVPIPLGILAFGTVLTNGCFWFEAIKQKKMLTGIFGATNAA